MGKRYYWLKMQNDFFRDKRIKKLRKIAGGDTFTVIYLKMMLSSLENEGIIEYEGVEETFADEIALLLDEDADNVAVTVDFLIRSGLLLDMGNNQFALPFVVEHLGSEGASAKRVREYRDRQKALQCNTEVTEVKQIGNGEKEKEIEKEIEIEIEKRESKTINYQKIVDMYNDICISFPRLQALSDARKKAIRARLNTYSLDDLKRLFEKAEASSFLKGKNNRNWSANFDWLMKDSNIVKVLEGNYDDKPGSSFAGSTNKVAESLDNSYNMMADWAEKE